MKDAFRLSKASATMNDKRYVHCESKLSQFEVFVATFRGDPIESIETLPATARLDSRSTAYKTTPI